MTAFSCLDIWPQMCMLSKMAESESSGAGRPQDRGSSPCWWHHRDPPSFSNAMTHSFKNLEWDLMKLICYHFFDSNWSYVITHKELLIFTVLYILQKLSSNIRNDRLLSAQILILMLLLHVNSRRYIISSDIIQCPCMSDHTHFYFLISSSSCWFYSGE